MAVHSKIYLQAKRNYREGLWNEERLRTLVAAGRLTAAEFEEVQRQAETIKRQAATIAQLRALLGEIEEGST